MIAGVLQEQADLLIAVEIAKTKIQKIADIRKVLTVFAAVIGLAEAVALGKPQGIVEAFNEVKEANATATA